jgi:hypothetical protein
VGNIQLPAKRLGDLLSSKPEFAEIKGTKGLVNSENALIGTDIAELSGGGFLPSA